MPGDIDKKKTKTKTNLKPKHNPNPNPNPNPNDRKIIGKGSYGCVYKPSLECEKGSIYKQGNIAAVKYDEYVSKFMKTSSAKKELNEFNIVSGVDKTNEYHLGMPIMCKPKISATSLVSMKQCKKLPESEIKKHYSILLLQNGGYDLSQFCEPEVFMRYIIHNKVSQTDKFLLEIHHLLKGLKLFNDNDILHYDLKPGNVLFDPVKYKLTFIDFGLMSNKAKIIRDSKINHNSSGVFHWSYSLECGLMNRFLYDKLMTNPLNFRKELIKMISNGETGNPLNLPLNHPEAFSVIFKYLSPAGKYLIDSENKIKTSDMINKFIDGLIGIKNLYREQAYEKTLQLTVDSIDTYSFGFTMQYVINCFYRNSCFTEEEYIRYTDFFATMYHFNILKRVSDIEASLNTFEKILEDNGVLKRVNKEFLDHKLVERRVTIKVHSKHNIGPLLRLEESLSVSLPNDIPSLNEIEKEDPPTLNLKTMSLNKCPYEKEYNVKTKRCVKKCKDGYYRNEQFKCVKNKHKSNKTFKQKANTASAIASDPASAIASDPASAIASALPPSNVSFSRLEKNRLDREAYDKRNRELLEEERILKEELQKIKDRQMKREQVPIKNVVIGKPCPPGKERNPKTNRCIKIRSRKQNKEIYGGYISKRRKSYSYKRTHRRRR